MFCLSRSAETDLGMVIIRRWNSQRSMTCAAVLLYLAPIDTSVGSVSTGGSLGPGIDFDLCTRRKEDCAHAH